MSSAAGLTPPSTTSMSTMCYDPATDRWSMAAPLITARSAGAAVVYRGQILYYGGECKNPQAARHFRRARGLRSQDG